jgi:SNF2 family DNA or RNA helicase
MIYDAAHDVVIYNTPDERLLSMTRGGRALMNGHKAIPATLFNLQVATYLKLPSPPPMMLKNYDYPRDTRSILAPWKSQLVASNFLALHPRAFDLSDMGTGKTLAALWAADFVMNQYDPGKCRCLIVAPLSTLQRVWHDTIFQHLMGRRRAIVLHGSAAKRRELFQTPADFYIINYDGLPIIAPELQARVDIRMAIVDEASAYKDRTTRRHKLGRAIYGNKDYLWELTGTPTPNAPTDAWGLAKLVNNCYGETYNSFHSRTMYQINQWKWMPRLGSHNMAHHLLQPAVRFAIEDCHDLPPCTYQFRDVDFTGEQKQAYKQLVNDAVLMTRQGPITAANEAVVRTKLLQVCAGAVYGNDHSVHRLDCRPRLEVLREVIEQSSHKIIIFASFTSVIDMLHSELKADYAVEVVYGGTSTKTRNQIFADFQAKRNPRIIIADPGTMAHGLTLTAATTIVWFSPTDKTEQYLQANKRIDRPGQQHPTTVVQLAATSTEREIYRRLANNESLMGLTLLLVREATDVNTHPTRRHAS